MARSDVDALDLLYAGLEADETFIMNNRIDGVLHGAGVEESQWLWKKTAEAFDRVFDTKKDALPWGPISKPCRPRR